jgi:antitoxin component HigA of HigAB toxin-antitoxin module
MKVKSFQKHLKQRLNKKEIAEIEKAAKIEHEALRTLQADISRAVIQYMSKNNIGFNDFVKKIGKSPTQVSKIIKGEANLTLATIAQIYAIMGYKVRIIAA